MLQSRKVLELVQCLQIKSDNLVENVFKSRNAVRNLGAIGGDPVGVVRKALDNIHGFVFAGEADMADNGLGALTGFNKIVQKTHKLFIKMSQRLMFGIGAGFPVHQVRLIARLEAHLDHLLNHGSP